MREREVPRRVRDLGDQTAADRRVESVERVVSVEAARRDDGREVEVAPDDGRNCQQIVGGLRQARESATHNIAHTLGKPELLGGEVAHPHAVSLVDDARLDEVGHDFLDEERVAFGLVE